MLGARGFAEVAGRAGFAGVEEDVVVGVGLEVGAMGGGCDVVAFVRCAEVGEDVGSCDQNGDREYEDSGKAGNCVGEEDAGGTGHKGEIEDLEERKEIRERHVYLP